jgi:mono/diheme cytochrome c family protein
MRARAGSRSTETLWREVTLGLSMFLALAGCDDRGSRDAAQGHQEPTVSFSKVSDDQVSHGERVARLLGCSGCHGDDLTGRDWSEPGFGQLWTANLARSVPDYSDQQLAEVIRTGVHRDGRELWGMPSHLFTTLSSTDMAALIAYLRSVPPKGESHPPPIFEEGARREIADGTLKSSPEEVREHGGRWPPDAGEQHRLARYIVRGTCAECHGLNLEGGQPLPEAALRPDLRMVAAYERDDFHRLLRAGKAAGDREIGLMSEVARGRYRHFTDEEVDAIYRYLQAVGNVEQD